MLWDGFGLKQQCACTWHIAAHHQTLPRARVRTVWALMHTAQHAMLLPHTNPHPHITTQPHTLQRGSGRTHPPHTTPHHPCVPSSAFPTHPPQPYHPCPHLDHTRHTRCPLTPLRSTAYAPSAATALRSPVVREACQGGLRLIQVLLDLREGGRGEGRGKGGAGECVVGRGSEGAGGGWG